MCEYLVHARLDYKYGGTGVILCPIPPGKLNIAFSGGVLVSKSETKSMEEIELYYVQYLQGS